MSSPSSDRNCRSSSVFSRWWMTTHYQPFTSRMWVFVFLMIVILPFAYSEDQHTLQGPHDEVTTYRNAKVDIFYTDPDTKKSTKTHFKGKYGVESVIARVSGVVMHAVSSTNPNSKSSKMTHSGCTKYENKLPSKKWIALVERGGCKFTQKLRIATKLHNASALVIYSDGDFSEVIGHDAIDSTSVFLLRKEGLKVVGLLDRGAKVTMDIVPGKEVTMDGGNIPNSISKTSVLFVSVSFIVLMVVSLAWLVFYYIQRFRYSHAKERLARLLACAAKKAIAKIPQKTIKAGDKELEGDFDQCAVCIEQYKPHDVIRILPCRHVFHKSCIDPWLLDQRSCPMCKLDILRAYGMQVSGSQESVHRDPESGPVTQVVSEEPEVRFNVMEDTRAEVLLVPHTWLHVHADREMEREGEDGELQEVDENRPSTSSSCRDPHLDDDIAVLLPPSPIATSCSHSNNVSRAQKRDKVDSLDAETKALISSGTELKHQLSIDEDEDEINDLGVREDTLPGGLGLECAGGAGAAPFEPDRASQTSSSSWTGSSRSLHGPIRCKEIDISVEVNHETSA